MNVIQKSANNLIDGLTKIFRLEEYSLSEDVEIMRAKEL